MLIFFFIKQIKPSSLDFAEQHRQ